MITNFIKKTSSLIVIVGIFFSGSLLDIPQVNAASCIQNTSFCPSNNICGAGLCTQWTTCSAGSGSSCPVGWSEYYCYTPYNCSGGPSCSPCQNNPAPPSPGYCGDTQCNNGETACSCPSDNCGTCNYIAACTWTPNNPIGCTGDGTNRLYVNGVPTRPGCCGGLVEDWQGTCGCPVCTVANPTAPALSTPANNSVVASNNPLLTWTANGGWGNGCPSSTLQYRVFLSASCTASYVNIATLSSSTTSFQLNNLNWGSSYCWYVQKSNGSATANSPVWRFVVNNNPIITSSTFGADTCGYGITGRFDSISPNKVNPLTFNVGFSDPEADSLSGIFIAFAPQSALNLNTVSYDQVYAAVTNNNAIGTLLGYTTAGTLTSAWGYNMQSGGANSPNTPGTATLLGAGTTSKATLVSPGNWTGTVSIRFENSFPSGLYNVYVMATVLNPDGSYSTPNQGSSSSLMMTKVATWSFDMTNPTGSIAVSNYTGNNFTAAWSGTDASGLKNAFSYIVASTTGSTLTDTTGGYAINPLGTTDLNYPTASNAGIGIANLPTSRNYTYTGTSDYTLKLALEDRACNVYTATAGATLPYPWLYSREGIISANGGVNNIKIPTIVPTMNIPNFITPIDGSGNTIFAAETRIDLSTDSALSGNASLPTPATTISNRNNYTYNYNNQAVLPDPRSNIGTWNAYVLDLVSQNAIELYTDNTSGTLTKSGNISTYIDSLKGSASNTTSVYAINVTNGTLNLNAITCNRKVILISANSMTLVPDIKRSGTGGCILVTGQSFNISSGTAKTNTTLAGGGDSSYDLIDSFLISNTGFNAPLDTSRGATFQYDGLIIKGGVLTNTTTMARNLNGAGNSDQPTIIFQYDPFYALTFKDALATRFYTIREYIP